MRGRPRHAVQGIDEVGTVTALTHEGEGVVRNGKTAFIPGALPAESVRFRRTRHHRQHDQAELIEVIEQSPARVTPRCAHFGVCGGCALQHLAPAAQLEAKEAELRDSFERVAGIRPAEWLAPLRGPVWHYRRRARLGAKYVAKKGRVVVGFRERLAPYVADVRRCEVLAPPVAELIEPLATLLTELTIRERVPQIEVAVGDNAVALVLRVLEPPDPSDLSRLRDFAALHSVRVFLQPKGLDSVRPLEATAVEPLEYRLSRFDLRLQFAPTDFVQINGPVNEALVARAVDLLALEPASVVLDLYCGIGNFTLALARAAARVVGVEGDAGLVARARENARLNGLNNVEFHVADLGQAIDPQTSWLRHGFTHVLLDPPRAGASEIMPLIASLDPRRILYISCHPGSLARDAGLLVSQHAMGLQAAGVLDMFPHTTHVESLALLVPGMPPREAT
ncbi:MAG TPA: 23S rRNA (uracil(1939)-C(5))-methyltransferase RlmD [Steroidobacteraceae bacterium]